MSPPDSILAAELRAARPAASPELRARVLELAAREPEPRRRRLRTPRVRRAALVLAPAALLAAIAGAVVGGVVSSSSSSPARRAVPAMTLRAATGDAATGGRPPSERQTLAPNVLRGAPVAPSRTRAQSYEADLRLRVGNLSSTTKRALRLTRSFGGFVRSVDYGSGTEAGTASLVVRIPLGSVQAAIVRFSELGAILEQHVSIRDVQPSVDARFRRLQALRRDISTLQRRLADAKLAPDVRKQLEARLTRLRTQLVALRREQAQAQKRASFATVSLSLTSRKPAAAAPSRPGRIERALDHAGRILVRELVVLVYVAVIGVPIVALALLLLGGERLRRRRATDRLLASR
jgi:hypothetical protein